MKGGEACTGMYHLLDIGIDWRIILRRTFRKWDVGVWTGLSWLRIEKWWALVHEVINLLSTK
jgi:hypothetical protein